MCDVDLVTTCRYPNAIQDLAGAAETLYTAMGGKDNKGIAVDVFCAWAKEIPPAELDRMFGFDIVDPDFVDFDDPHMLADSGTNVVGTKSTMSSMKASYTGTSMPSRRGSTEAAPASAADPPSTPPPQPAGGSMFVGGGSPVSEASPGGHDAAKNLGLLDLSDTGYVHARVPCAVCAACRVRCVLCALCAVCAVCVCVCVCCVGVHLRENMLVGEVFGCSSSDGQIGSTTV